jgi:hypothetical protein
MELLAAQGQHRVSLGQRARAVQRGGLAPRVGADGEQVGCAAQGGGGRRHAWEGEKGGEGHMMGRGEGSEAEEDTPGGKGRGRRGERGGVCVWGGGLGQRARAVQRGRLAPRVGADGEEVGCAAQGGGGRGHAWMDRGG